MSRASCPGSSPAAARQQPGIEPAKRPDHYLNNLVRMLDKEMRATVLPLLAARRVFVFGKLLGR